MLFENIFPALPSGLGATYLMVGGVVCTILLIYSIFVEQEHRSDLIRLLGAAGLFWYADYINNVIFMIAMGGIAVASAVEFIEIYLGLHKHSQEDLKRYKKMWRIKK